MATDKCPWCNAKCSSDGKGRSWYTCGTSVRDQYDRGIDCVRRSLQSTINRMQPVVDAVTAMLAIDKEHRFQALDEVIEAGKKYNGGD